MFFMQTSVRDFSYDQLQTVKSFFTDSQWDLIDSALSEYQDHDEEFLKEVFDDEEILWSTQKRLNELFK
tara:strand:- start:197 stop:403 length:207 start_codon:yes stop_codon:yes gene_type:complete